MLNRLTIGLLVLTIVLYVLTLVHGQDQEQFTVTDLKTMIADRDISIEVLNRQVRDLQQKLAVCQKPPEVKK